MSEASKINVKISAGSDPNQKKIFSRVLDLDTVIKWINFQGMDEYTTKGLIKIASSYPTSALGSFKKNFNLMIQRVRAMRKEEENKSEEAKIKEL